VDALRKIADAISARCARRRPGYAVVSGGAAPRAAELTAAQFGTIVAAAEECDAPVVTGVMPTGGWR
jgi:hypothetical protein